jgi:hypothetical protein
MSNRIYHITKSTTFRYKKVLLFSKLILPFKKNFYIQVLI